MKLKLTSIQAGSSLSDLDEYVPENIYDFTVEVTLDIEDMETIGNELFYLDVCSIAYLNKEIECMRSDFGHARFIIDYFDASLIREKIQRYVNAIEGETWDEIRLKMCRIARSEFDDYTPAQQ